MVGACEIDKYARTIYSRHFPGVKIYKDATKIKPEELPDFDILVAGFPCQAFSIAGNRLGFEESRGTLFFEIARIAKQKRPRLLLLENVKGLLSHDNGKTFAEILATLDELGYDAEWQVLNSKYFVPQNRERIFIIGHLRGKCARQVFPLGEGGPGDNESGIKYIKQSDKTNGRVYDTKGVARTLTANESNKTGFYAVSIENTGANGRRIKDDGDPQFWDRQNCGVGVLKNKRIRRLTPIECERLQGFPDRYTDGISDTQRYRCLGNAVTVPVVEYIVKNLHS
jgi:DNA (cytosine-5)-methyltransferase 1